jgi:hypothetical protein
MNLVGVLLWPLGWAVAALITQGILDYMTDPSLKYLDPTASFYTLQESLGVFVIAFWILFSTIAGPLVIQRVCSNGILAGGQLISGAFGSFLQAATTSAGAAAAATPARMPLLTASTAVLAASLSTLSSSAGLGSAGSIIPAGIPRGPGRPLPDSDITGDKSARELISKTKKS